MARGRYSQLSSGEMIAAAEEERDRALALRREARIIEREADFVLGEMLGVVENIRTDEDEERARPAITRLRDYAIKRGWDNIKRVADEHHAIAEHWSAERALEAALDREEDPIKKGYKRNHA